jgi:hypothetical protein
MFLPSRKAKALFMRFCPPKRKISWKYIQTFKWSSSHQNKKIVKRSTHIIFQIRLPRQYIPSQQKEITGLQIYLFYNFRLCQVICEKLFHNVKTMAPPRSYNLVEGRQPRVRDRESRENAVSENHLDKFYILMTKKHFQRIPITKAPSHTAGFVTRCRFWLRASPFTNFRVRKKFCKKFPFSAFLQKESNLFSNLLILYEKFW